MKEVKVEPCGCFAVHHGKKRFIDNTIDGILGFLRKLLYRRDSPEEKVFCRAWIRGSSCFPL